MVAATRQPRGRLRRPVSPTHTPRAAARRGPFGKGVLERRLSFKEEEKSDCGPGQCDHRPPQVRPSSWGTGTSVLLAAPGCPCGRGTFPAMEGAGPSGGRGGLMSVLGSRFWALIASLGLLATALLLAAVRGHGHPVPVGDRKLIAHVPAG
jgi:hypothetical protein